jgi:hypothetical protein
MANQQRPGVTDTNTAARSRHTSTPSRPPSAARPGRSLSRPAITESDDVGIKTDRRAISETPHDRWTLGIVVVLASLMAGFYGYFFVSMFWFEEAFGRVFWSLGLPPFPASWPLP